MHDMPAEPDHRSKRIRQESGHASHGQKDMPQTGVLKEDFTDDVMANTHRIKQLFSRLNNPWILTTGTVVENKMMEMILSHPAEIPKAQ